MKKLASVFVLGLVTTSAFAAAPKKKAAKPAAAATKAAATEEAAPAAAAPAHAAAHHKSGGSKLAYGSAGCGGGTLIIGAGEGFSQVFVATSNQSSWQPVGITMGTSNCVPPEQMNSAGIKEWMPNFVAANKLSLAQDVARGNGEVIEGLASVLGCSDSAELGTTLQSDYSKIFGTVNAAEISDSLFKSVQGNSRLNCTKVNNG